MSAAGAIMVGIRRRENQRLQELALINYAWESNYDIGMDMLEYPKVKYWKLIRKIISKLQNFPKVSKE